MVRGRNKALVLRCETCQLEGSEEVCYFDIASWTSTPSCFTFNIEKVRPYLSNSKAELMVETYEAAVIAASVGDAARSLKAKMEKMGLLDKEVRAHVKLQQEEFSLDELRRYAQTREFTCLQAAWLILSCADRFTRLDTACIVLPRLLHMETFRWTVRECFEDEADWPNLQARLKGLLAKEVVETISEPRAATPPRLPLPSGDV